jgi:Protein of unknown function (DUF3306)
MSDEEFLKRWSRRKQEAKSGEKSAEKSGEKSAGQGSAAPETAEAAPAEPPEAEIDLAKLPSLDSIDAATDITAFLQKGIPAELGRAALRRAWAADPTVRDFVGLAENAWDFTDPNAMPGFGPLQGTPEQIGAMVERVIGGARETAEKLASELPEKEQVQQKADQEPGVSAPTEALQAPVNEVPAPRAQAERVAAAQPEASEEDGDVTPIRRRTHGGALPN